MGRPDGMKVKGYFYRPEGLKSEAMAEIWGVNLGFCLAVCQLP